MSNYSLLHLGVEHGQRLAAVIGNAARQARRALQLTQQQVAERIDVSVEFYSRMERGLAYPSLEVFLRMLDVLGVRADTLLGLDAAHATGPAAVPLTSPGDPREVRYVIAALQKLPASASRFLTALLKEFERLEAPGKRGRGRIRIGSGRRPSPKPADHE